MLRHQLAGWLARVRGIRAEADDIIIVNGVAQALALLAQLMELLGLRRVRLYEARSPCLTFLANNGVPDPILARGAGHTNIQTAKRWYVKPDVEDLRGATTTWDDMHGFGGEGA